ncbi:MAG TPA: BatA domain-containing protein [Pirellulales bacterium]|jgi:hypothetical protein|nr:BatA domain-containing protein [Pirellulales bacterium]
MPRFFATAFALAGLLAAVGPLAIHLLNRRRARVVEWAAMELLREAQGERRKRLRLRDLMLLALRTACVLLFALAMARPYWSRVAGEIELNQPVHAVLLVDNSMSMGYEQLGGTLLDAAKARAQELLDRLPSGSRASVLPLCGDDDEFIWEPYRSLGDAVRYLRSIEVVDLQASTARAMELAARACGAASELKQKRVVLFGDQQAINWPAETAAAPVAELAELQIVDVAADSPENAWVASFAWQDELADAETSGNFLATVRYDGRKPRTDVAVTLLVDGTAVAGRVIDLKPGQARELSFPFRFSSPEQPGKPAFVTAMIELAHDRLPADDERVLVVPVASALPVLFVDDVGAQGPVANRDSATHRLQRLLAPAVQGDRSQGLVQIELATIDELTGEVPAATALVVAAGVERPEGAVPWLRHYVENGGQLLIAAGARFDPAAWQQAAWLEGDGILPVPLRGDSLRGDLIGPGPEIGSAGVEPLWLDTATMNHAWFRLEQMSGEELADLYHAPLFFRAVAVDDDSTDFERWAASLPPRSRPRTLARFGDGSPFVVEREIGRGLVTFLASGIGPDWNTLGETSAVVLYDRMLRSMLARSLPRRNLDPRESYSLAVEGAGRLDRHFLTRPNGQREELAIEALGDGSFGLTVHDLRQRGLYTIRSADASSSAASQNGNPWQVTLAVNGPPRESELRPLARSELRSRLATANARVLTGHESISLAGSDVVAPDAWKWLMGGALALLLAEVVCLAGTSRWREGVA